MITFYISKLPVPRYKLWSEVQAYKCQAQYYADDRRLLFARFIATKYKLSISATDAHQLLCKD